MDTVALVQKKAKPASPARKPRVYQANLSHDDNVAAILRGGAVSDAAPINWDAGPETSADAYAEYFVGRHVWPLVQRQQRLPTSEAASAGGQRQNISYEDGEMVEQAEPAGNDGGIWAIRNGAAGTLQVQRSACPTCGPTITLTDGEVEEDRESDAPEIQTKLSIGTPGDTLEQEADTVADRVMRSWTSDYTAPTDAAAGGGISGTSMAVIQRNDNGDDVDDDTLDAQEEAEEQRLQCAVKDVGASGEEDGRAAIARTLRQRTGRGRPLAERTRRFMEHRLGFDFSSVCIHQDTVAAGLTEQLNAHAFATGCDIYFASGAYRPGDRAGDRLLAHELTHVVQQAGGGQRAAPLVQRSVERKGYYDGVPGLTGSSVHALVERRLRADSRNRNLITEAPIPHATRNRVAFNVLGFADMYRATANKVSGFRGNTERIIEPPPVTPATGTAAQQAPPPQPTAERTYQEVSQRIRNRAGGPVQWRPELQTRSDGSQGMRHVFPSNFSVADLKPWAPGRIGGGIVQIRNYIEGLTLFGAKAKADLGGTGPTPQGRAMQPGSVNLPADVDFRQFNINNNVLGTGLRNGTRDERIWLIKPGPGLVLYVPVKLGTSADLRTWLRDNQRQLTQLKRQLRGTTPRINAPVDISTQRKTGKSSLLKRLHRITRPRVQRNSRTHRPGQVNWAALRRRWQRQRKQWRRGVRRYLRGRGRVLRTVAAVADRAGTSLGANSRVAGLGRNVEAIDFWSGSWGGFIGGLRFRLGRAWDFFARKLDAMRRRFRRWSRRAKAIGRGGVGVGWRGKLIRAILRAGGFAITQFLSDTFRVFATCASGLMQKALRQILDEASPETRQRFCELQQGFETISDELERLFRVHFAGYEETIESLRDVSFWVSLITSLIALIRIGVQVVSCLSPPALGCLWGLVAQVGIEVAVNLVVGTQWFQREVIGSRQVRNFFSRFFRPAQQGLLDAAINAVGLQTLRNGVSACNVTPESRDPLRGGAPGGLRGSALLRHRRRWEQTNRRAITQGIAQHYRNAQGQPATRRDAIAMLASVGFADLPPEQLRRILRQHRGVDGRIDMPQASRELVGVGTSRLLQGVDEALAEMGVSPSEPAEDRPAAPPRPPAGQGDTTVPAETRAPAATTPAPPAPAPAPEGGEGGVTVHTHTFRAPPPGRTGQGTRHSVAVDITAGMTAERQPNADRTFPVTLEFFSGGEMHRVTGVPVKLLGTRRHNDGRTIYEMELTRSLWVESINVTVFAGRFDFVFARGL